MSFLSGIITRKLQNGNSVLPEEYLSIASVLPPRMLGFFKSLALNLSPDNPSADGTVSGVVQGVTIYPPFNQA